MGRGVVGRSRVPWTDWLVPGERLTPPIWRRGNDDDTTECIPTLADATPSRATGDRRGGADRDGSGDGRTLAVHTALVRRARVCGAPHPRPHIRQSARRRWLPHH